MFSFIIVFNNQQSLPDDHFNHFSTACSSPKLTEISKCECKVYKNHYDYPSESPKFKTSLHCSKRINVQYFIQSKSGICQERNWQGYTPCSNPRYRDLSLMNLNNCNNLKSSLWCEAELADDQRKCKDVVFSRVKIILLN